jgi:hypothetical protein
MGLLGPAGRKLSNKELLLSADTMRECLVALRVCHQKGAAAEFRDVRNPG